MRPVVAPRIPLYLLANAGFALLVGVGYAIGGGPNPRLLYVITLFALCSSFIIDLDGLNGRYAMLAFFMLVYFVTFGVGDLGNLFTGGESPAAMPASHGLDGAEAVILVGGFMLVLGYRAAVRLVSAGYPVQRALDWPKPTILIVGLIFWVIGTIATYRWYVYVIPDTTDEAFRKGLSSIGPAMVIAYLLGQMLQPLGTLLLAYAWTVFRNSYSMVLIIAVVTTQLFIGFVSDSKGLAMIGIILVIMTSTLIRGRIPKGWVAVGLVFVTLVYPYFTAYRAAVHGAGIARTSVVENFAAILQKTANAKDKINTGKNRAQTFLERSNVKGNVEVIVAKAGNGVAFQYGHTLSPILEAFIPKIALSSKVTIPTGQLFNKQFHLVEGDEVYISPSHLGELYWNFGWAGVVIGMGIIGLLCGWVSARFNLGDVRTVTRVLVILITVKQLIVSFESTVSDCYVVWLRALAAIGILHIVFARARVIPRASESTIHGPKEVAANDRPSSGRLFPNLLT